MMDYKLSDLKEICRKQVEDAGGVLDCYGCSASDICRIFAWDHKPHTWDIDHADCDNKDSNI